ncbi:MAG TPA: PLD nuclease N-terminal domain-containing protein [Frankiaceae bacterium]|nr:PLD nuclease N-terminal domain-containing protein [Frankiaceae bacterium]
MNWSWHALWIALVLIPVTIIWVGCVFDIFRRDDLHPVSQILWLLAVLVLPVFGGLVYLVARPRHAGSFAQEAPGGRSLSQQLNDLDRLHSTGAISDREFQLAKQDALAKVPTPRGAAAYSTDTATVQGAGSSR